MSEEVFKEVAGSFAYALAVFANWQIACQRRWGFLVGLLVNCIWIGIGAYLGFYSMICWSVIFMIPNIRGYFGGKKDSSTVSEHLSE